MTHPSRSVAIIACALAALSSGAAAAQEAALAQENYLQADANGDGRLAYAEFATFIDLNAADEIGNAKRVSARGLHARAFDRVDRNGDGIVTPEELQALR